MAQKGRVTLARFGKSALWGSSCLYTKPAAPLYQEIAAKELLQMLLFYDSNLFYLFKDSALYYSLSQKMYKMLWSKYEELAMSLFADSEEISEGILEEDVWVYAYNINVSYFLLTPRIFRVNSIIYANVNTYKDRQKSTIDIRAYSAVAKSYLGLWSIVGFNTSTAGAKSI